MTREGAPWKLRRLVESQLPAGIKSHYTAPWGITLIISPFYSQCKFCRFHRSFVSSQDSWALPCIRLVYIVKLVLAYRERCRVNTRNRCDTSRACTFHSVYSCLPFHHFYIKREVHFPFISHFHIISFCHSVISLSFIIHYIYSFASFFCHHFHPTSPVYLHRGWFS